jgi:Uma2 family endonuclease
MAQSTKRWTREEVLALPEDGNRYELLDGELLVTPSPTYIHQRAVWLLYQQIFPYADQYRVGVAGLAPSDLDLKSGQAVQPDLFVVEVARPAPGQVPSWGDLEIPFLIVEVLSPSTAHYDRHKKRIRFQRSRVAEYWIVDAEARLIERWRPDDQRPEILTERIEWQPRPELPALTIDLGAYFRAVWQE